MHEAQRTNKSSYKLNWIRSVIATGQLVEARMLEEDVSNPIERECYWIKRLKDEGCRLTNLTSGGEGTVDKDPIVKQATSIAVTARWADPVYRKRQMRARRKSGNKISQSVKALWQNPTYRKMMLDVRIAKDSYNKHWSKPGSHEKHSKTMKAVFAKPVNRRKLMKAVRAGHTPAIKAKRSVEMKLRWQKPEYREKILPYLFSSKRPHEQHASTANNGPRNYGNDGTGF